MTTERWLLVLVAPIDRPSFCDRGESTACCWNPDGKKCCSADMEQAERDASPGAALLSEVLAARDEWHAAGEGTLREDAATIRLIAALDKLGPAQPCQPGEHHE